MRPLPATILIVEDEPVIASAMQESLQGAGSRVLVASCMQEVLALCIQDHPDIALINSGKMAENNEISLADMLCGRFGVWPMLITGARGQDIPTAVGSADKWPVLYKPFTIPQLIRFVSEKAKNTFCKRPAP